MGRIKVIVDKTRLWQVIDGLEQQNTYPNRSALYAAVAETEWAKSQKITPSVVLLRVSEFGLEDRLKTPKGKKGNANLRPPLIKTPRADKLASKKYVKSFSEIKRTTPTSYQKLIAKIEGGSLKAAIKLKCCECSSYDKSEIRECAVLACPLWPVRPYQHKDNDSEEE